MVTNGEYTDDKNATGRPGDGGTGRPGDLGTGRRGDCETGRPGDGETERQRDRGTGRRKFIIFLCRRCERVYKWGKWRIPEGEDLRELILNAARIDYIDRTCTYCEPPTPTRHCEERSDAAILADGHPAGKDGVVR